MTLLPSAFGWTGPSTRTRTTRRRYQTTRGPTWRCWGAMGGRPSCLPNSPSSRENRSSFSTKAAWPLEPAPTGPAWKGSDASSTRPGRTPQGTTDLPGLGRASTGSREVIVMLGLLWQGCRGARCPAVRRRMRIQTALRRRPCNLSQPRTTLFLATRAAARRRPRRGLARTSRQSALDRSFRAGNARHEARARPCLTTAAPPRTSSTW